MEDLLNKKEELLPELELYKVIIGTLGDCIRHPLIYSVPHYEVENAKINWNYKQKVEAADKALKNKEFDKYIWLHEIPCMIQAFMEIEYELTDKQYWRYLAEIWIDSENIWQNQEIWLDLFSSDRSYKHFMMEKEDRKTFRKLPEVLIVYRGCQSGINEHGLSYTLDKSKAEWFAGRRHNTSAKVIKRVISKD